MRHRLMFKLGAIALLIMLLLIPLSMIDGVIDERQGLRDRVLHDIARSSAYQQQLTGPLLVVPYRKTVREWKVDQETKKRVLEEREVGGRLYFLPETFGLDGRLKTELRARGIYEARLYHLDGRLRGHFQLPARLGLGDDFADYRFEQPFLAVGISDIRGIGNALSLTLNGETTAFRPGSQVKLLGDGVHAPVAGLDPLKPVRMDFVFDLRLQGTSQLAVTPVGRESRVMLAADWPHPSFIGNYLPAEREVRQDGFDALWQTSFFSTNLEEALKNCVHKASCEEFNNRSFGVSLIDPVDQYLKSERAIKYALLFIALTFAGFFLFEVLKRLAVHPIQYGLVGMAMAIFYLLLLSLSEHVGFSLAYALASSGCVLLIGFYVSYVLQSMVRGLGFAAGLASLYGLLYGLLSAEDYALLMGSLLLFGMLGVIMVLTRKLDWYGLTEAVPSGQRPDAPNVSR